MDRTGSYSGRSYTLDGAIGERFTGQAVHEPELDMERRAGAPAPEKWRWLSSAMAVLAGASPLIRRPSRAVDRDHSEFPFARD